jgi:hypothetical protein
MHLRNTFHAHPSAAANPCAPTPLTYAGAVHVQQSYIEPGTPIRQLAGVLDHSTYAALL